MLDYEDAGLSFNYDHGLELGPASCMCNFGMAYEASIGHSGHVSIARRVVPHLPRAAWPLVHWDEQEQEGTTFAVDDARWLSGWLARFAAWESEDLGDVRDALASAAAQAGDDAVGAVIDAILAGETEPGALYARVAPGSLLARTYTLAEAQGLRLGRKRYTRRTDEERASEAAAWQPLVGEDPLYNAPAAFAASHGFDATTAWAWLRRNLKYDVGGSIGVADLTRAAARRILEDGPLRDSPYDPVLRGYEEGQHVGGDPWHEAGRALLARGEVLEAITAFENAILFERGWSEEFHADAFEGIREAAGELAAPDFLAYLDGI